MAKKRRKAKKGSGLTAMMDRVYGKRTRLGKGTWGEGESRKLWNANEPFNEIHYK